MSARTFVMITVVLVSGIPFPTLAASFDANPGAWQMSTNTLIVGTPLSPEALASMPPEKRARVEKAMKESAAKPVTVSHQTCVTQEDLDQDRVVRTGKYDGKCTRKVLSKSATRIVMEQICPAPNAATLQMTIEARTPESLSASIVRVRGDGKGKDLMDVKGFWLGPSCAGITDDD